jgi:hypothetical protein
MEARDIYILDGKADPVWVMSSNIRLYSNHTTSQAVVNLAANSNSFIFLGKIIKLVNIIAYTNGCTQVDNKGILTAVLWDCINISAGDGYTH